MQWDNSENAGFTKGKPWLGINSNYRYINHASQKNDSNSVLNFYKTLITLRKNTRCLVYGEFLPIFADDHIMIYQRRLDGETYTIALNFSFRKIKVPKKHAPLFSGEQIASASGENWEGSLIPWEGILVKNS
jgi:glycosidase